MDVDKFAWLKASKYRQNVLKALGEGPSTPSDIANETGYHLSHVSNTLSELVEKKLIECLTPDRRKGKLYDKTGEGKDLMENI